MFKSRTFVVVAEDKIAHAIFFVRMIISKFVVIHNPCDKRVTRDIVVDLDIDTLIHVEGRHMKDLFIGKIDTIC